ncbi:histidine phosphatase family protein [Donghicola mangrovi]|uniref:Histidine phosphatase family protein n=1 Tax=Donghicola mangrovi TaxID=2729614 RepID=A0A850PYF3_9RHOB|nr:histidine phosphatase family protein [Donghicola mangrovi]NVO21784.1 histidine phosphatase family protein [Donghicola mangrovi]
MSRLYLVRHGPTHVKRLIGWTDVPADLSDTAALTRLSAALPDAPVVSSDLLRARTTADAICGGRPRLPHDPRLREIHMGAWEDRDWQDVDSAYGDALRDYYEHPGDTAPPEGESWNTLSARVWSAITELMPHHPTLIVVAHMGPILSVVQRAKGITAYEALGHRIDPLSLTEIDMHVPSSIRINHLP